jgi:hypothetical protein
MLDKRLLLFGATLCAWIVAGEVLLAGRMSSVSTSAVSSCVVTVVDTLGVPCGRDGDNLYAPGVAVRVAPPWNGWFPAGLMIALAATWPVGVVRRLLAGCVLVAGSACYTVLWTATEVLAGTTRARWASAACFALFALVAAWTLCALACRWCADLSGNSDAADSAEVK